MLQHRWVDAVLSQPMRVPTLAEPYAACPRPGGALLHEWEAEYPHGAEVARDGATMDAEHVREVDRRPCLRRQERDHGQHTPQCAMAFGSHGSTGDGLRLRSRLALLFVVSALRPRAARHQHPLCDEVEPVRQKL